MQTLHTERLLLRAWQPGDYADLYEYAKLPNVGPNAGWPPHQDEEESKNIVKMFIENNDTYAVVWKENNKVIGSVGLHERTPDETLKHLN